jgi:hypothetical protein
MSLWETDIESELELMVLIGMIVESKCLMKQDWTQKPSDIVDFDDSEEKSGGNKIG